MTRRSRSALLVALVGVVAAPLMGVGAPATSAPPSSTPRYHGYRCPDPVGHRVTQCRLGIHGSPDLSRRAWAAIRAREVTISVPFAELAPNPDAPVAGARDWPLLDSLGQPMGRLAQTREHGKVTLTAVDGTSFKVVAMNVRGHGCAADPAQMRDAALVQLIAPQAPSHGTQAFLAVRALGASPAATAFASQLGGGTGCGPSRRPRGRLRPLRDPAVGATAHARLSNGQVNTVTEYDAKPPFGNTVYFMANTTSVRVGGVARGMIRVGTPVATADRFRTCDPNSDGTLTWRYVAIATGSAARPYLYGWLPARCPAKLRR